MELPGDIVREHKNRRTVRAAIGGRTYFIKTHRPAALREIVKNAARLRWPVLTAEPEWRAIARLEELGVPTTRVAGFGRRGRFPRVESFIITEELAGMIHLDELPPRLRPLPARQRARIQRRLIAEVARIARVLHHHGLNHRDFYLNHFMIRDRDWATWELDRAREGQSTDDTNGTDQARMRRERSMLDNAALSGRASTALASIPSFSSASSVDSPVHSAPGAAVHVIDLHRMQVRRPPTPSRWAVKDISGLLFSAFDADLTSRDWLRFLAAYWGEPWRARWDEARGWRAQVLRRAVSLYRSERGRSPRLPGGPPSCA